MAKPNVVTKAQLIEAAKQCVVESGIENLTLRTVAAKANVSQGTIYHHFQTKERLMLDIVEDTCRASWRDLQDPADAETFIHRALRSAQSRQGHDSSFHQLFLSLVVISLHNQQMKDRIGSVMKAENEELTRILQTLYAESPVNGLSHATVAILLNALIDGLAIQSLMIEQFPREEVFQSLQVLVESFIRSDHTRMGG